MISFSQPQVFEDLLYDSCLNGWTMGNIASSAVDLATFFFDLFTLPKAGHLPRVWHPPLFGLGTYFEVGLIGNRHNQFWGSYYYFDTHTHTHLIMICSHVWFSVGCLPMLIVASCHAHRACGSPRILESVVSQFIGPWSSGHLSCLTCLQTVTGAFKSGAFKEGEGNAPQTIGRQLSFWRGSLRIFTCHPLGFEVSAMVKLAIQLVQLSPINTATGSGHLCIFCAKVPSP